ncbi:MAG: hypothetical protein GWN79_28720, partial [Actinobacteria bacterium]|nr:hypothetical protein [Actinomycetota bacterium]NIT99174.1 hypothetical protein [Actinomycetota bacterium]NIU22780.1 hypothetical protein [Actinomycetota bacterium]NIV59391.1 hypothetical protein [Actinomycetota bacterium]NIX54150.1 hypothetical protein [Actinomycetota bacterium]
MGVWRARPALAWAIRAALVVVPLVASWAAVRLALRELPPSGGVARTLVWVAGAVA